jgi:hypothetical protein
VRILSVAVAGVLASLSIAACGSSATPRVSTASTPETTTRPQPGPPISRPTARPKDPNYDKALSEARSLLEAASIPPGADLDHASAPPALPGPIMGTPTSDHLVEVTRLWTVPESMAAALAWISAHPPSGLTRSGSASGRGPGGTSSAGFAWSAPDSDAYSQAQLDIGVAPDSANDSVVRADGIDIWVSSTPASDTTIGSRLRITLVRGCPESIAGYVDVTNPDPALRSQMLLRDQPTAGLLCRYEQGSSQGGVRPGPIRLGAVEAGRLARSVNAIRLGSSGDGSTSCPADIGLEDIIVFSYAAHPDVDLWYHSSGCRGLDNGYVSAAEGGNPSFYEGFMSAFAAVKP